MFNDLGPAIRGEEKRVRVEDAVTWSMRFLKKDDRIVWYLSILQRYAFYLLREKPITKTRRVRRKIIQKLRGFSERRIIEDFKVFCTEKWEHYADMQAVFMCPQMLEFPFYSFSGFKSIPLKADQVFDHFEKVEARLTVKSEGDRFCNDGISFLESHDGWTWFQIQEGFSTQEAKAMRHCGNGQGKRGDILLSLREPVRKGKLILWKPHLTFILNKKYLGEMKGFANTKPSSNLHSHILCLLLDERIKGLQGGGYLAQSNFSFLDLDDHFKEEILQKRPDFEFDLIPDQGEPILRLPDGLEWQELEKSSISNSVEITIPEWSGNMAQWLVLRKFIKIGKVVRHMSLAWCFVEKGKISPLHQEGGGLSKVAFQALFTLPIIECFHEDILEDKTSWRNVLDLESIGEIVEKKPSLLSSTSLRTIVEKVGVGKAFVNILNFRHNLGAELSGDRLILQTYDSLFHFAESTRIGSMTRKLLPISNQLFSSTRIDLYGMDWLYLEVLNSNSQTIGLVICKSSIKHLFETLDFEEERSQDSLLREIIYRFGPPDPRILSGWKAA
jgi:hypothetical protein